MPAVINKAPIDLYRFEQKFLPERLTVHEMAALLRVHPALFREVYPERIVHNLYLDSPDLRCYRDHINGATHRVKVRFRWYGENSGLSEPTALELKIKQGLVSRKVAYPLGALHLNGGHSNPLREAAFTVKALPAFTRLQLKQLHPALLNTYHRRYFCSSDGKYRVTLDWDLRFTRPGCVEWAAHEHPGPFAMPNLILELKFSPADAEGAEAITNQFPFRLTRCSKYILGIERLNSAHRRA